MFTECSTCFYEPTHIGSGMGPAIWCANCRKAKSRDGFYVPRENTQITTSQTKETYIYCKSCKCVSRINCCEDTDKIDCPSCGMMGYLRKLETKENSIPSDSEDIFIKCNHCEQIMFEHSIILAGDCEIECCPYCGRDGGLMDSFKSSEIVELISKWLQKAGHEEASKALDCQFDL